MLAKVSKLLKKRSSIILIGLNLGLAATVVYFLLVREANSSVTAQEAVSHLYNLKAGETLADVATRFDLDLRTLRCVNPDWQVGASQITLPLSSDRRHVVTAGQTLSQVARQYDLEPSLITDYPLNFWNGCSGVKALSDSQTLPPGLILYVPDAPDVAARSRLASGSLPAGAQALNEDYAAEDAPQNALTNPYPLEFQVPVSLTTAPAPVVTRVSSTQAPPQTNGQTPQGLPPTPEPLPTTGPGPGRPKILVGGTPAPTVPPPAFQPADKQPLSWPLHGVITTYFSASHPAIDIATAVNTPIFAAQSGVVFYAALSPYGYGNFVQIDHGDGRHTHYAHLSAFVVKEGQTVSQGQLIGYEGSTGNSTGPHLHFELVIEGRYVDPLAYLPR